MSGDPAGAHHFAGGAIFRPENAKYCENVTLLKILPHPNIMIYALSRPIFRGESESELRI